ncbi:hypothetical protein MMC13_004304 [Lambiella insularis]|nr:hypothetical protein [Lambiella insularis]
MASSSKWFVPTDEYNIATSDYTFCRQSAVVMQNRISSFNDWIFPREQAFQDYFTQMTMLSEAFLPFPGEGDALLLYADAPDTDPKHWQSILRDLSKKPQLKDTPEHLRKAEHVLHKAVRTELKLPLEKDGGPSDKEVRGMVEHHCQTGHLDAMLVAFVIGKQGAPLHKELLTILSGQDRSPKPRPTILYIGSVIDVVASTPKAKSGLACMYDFSKREVIIKQFSFEMGQPPKNSTDYYYLRQPAGDFAKAILKDTPSLSDSSKTDLVNLARYLLGDWVECHGKALDLSEEGVKHLDEDLTKIRKTLEEKKVPDVKPNKPTPGVPLEFKHMRWALQYEEANLRDIAVEAKEAGLTVAAENLAKYYDKTIKNLKQLAEHPNEPFNG